MSYITISDLNELIQNDVTGEEFILITDSNNESKKLKVGTVDSYIGDKLTNKIEAEINNTADTIQGIINQKVQDLELETKMTIFDEGIEVGYTNRINFIGATVGSLMNEDGSVDVYIPSISSSSPFNTNTGTTDARVTNINYIERHIGSPVTNEFYIGNWQPGSLQKCIKDNIISYSLNNKFMIEKNSIFYIELYQDNMISQLQFNIENGTYTSTDSKITALITNKIKELNHYSGNFSCSFDLSDIIGRFYVKIRYSGSQEYIFQENELFRDPNNIQATISTDFVIFNEVYRYLSGIKFLGYGSKIMIDNVLNNSKNYTYPINLMDIDAGLAGLGLYNISATDIVKDIKYNSQEEFLKEYSFIYNKYIYGDITINSRVNDWTNGNYNSKTKRSLINTYIDNSTRIYEDFTSELKRLKLNLNIFDSEIELESGELQVLNSRLVYPQLDFSEFYSNPNYSNKTGNRSYLRKFWHDNVSHSNGLFQLNSNILESDLTSGNVKIEISLDSIKWFDCSKDYMGGILQNGNGCRINSDSNSLNINNKIEFTLGLDTFTNISTQWGIYLKITFNESSKNKYIDTIQITNWN